MHLPAGNSHNPTPAADAQWEPRRRQPIPSPRPRIMPGWGDQPWRIAAPVAPPLQPHRGSHLGGDPLPHQPDIGTHSTRLPACETASPVFWPDRALGVPVPVHRPPVDVECGRIAHRGSDSLPAAVAAFAQFSGTNS